MAEILYLTNHRMCVAGCQNARFAPRLTKQVGRELLNISSGALDNHILVLSLNIASHGYHTQGIIEKSLHFRPPSPPSDNFIREAWTTVRGGTAAAYRPQQTH
eukprot:970015-Pelagomonas_calceolata.AAC.1